MSPEKRFETHFIKGKPTECWEWKSALNRNGYGIVNYRGKSRTSNNVSFELYVRKLNPGECACHKCDNRKCVNPNHLFAGTRGDNNRDMYLKGRNRNPRNEEHYNAKLSFTKADEIRNAKTAGETVKTIALRYGVSESTIEKIVYGIIWKKSHAPT